MRTVVIAAGVLCALTGSAHAQLQVFVWPAKFELAVPAGQTESRKVKVVNTGTRPVTVHAYTADWWYEADHYKRFAPAGTFPRSSASWISLRTPAFALQPGEERLVEYTLAVPGDAEGGHYAVLFFEVRPAPPKGGQGLVLRFGGRVGVLIAQFDPRTSKPRLAVEKVTVEPPSEVDPLRLAITVRNGGNVHVVPKGTATIVSKADGRMVGHFALEARPQYLPGQTGELSGDWPSRLPPGEYEILTTVSYFGSSATVERTTFSVR